MPARPQEQEQDIAAQTKTTRKQIAQPTTSQNELRRAWDLYTVAHDAQERPQGLRGQLSEQYIRRIALLRLGAHRDGGTVERVQVRSATVAVAPPPWSDGKTDMKPVYRELNWWPVTTADLPEGTHR